MLMLRLTLLATLLLLAQITTLTAAPRKIPERRLFFVASPPYHGNELLSDLCSTCNQVSSSFLRIPSMGGDVVLSAAKKGLTASYAERKEMFYGATDTVINALPEGWSYMDTNPMFVQTFHDIVLRDFASAHSITIILLRDHPARALSRLEQHSDDVTFFESSLNNNKMKSSSQFTLYTQHTRLATTRPLKSWKQSSEKELLIGYLIDVESRRQQIRAVAARRRRVEVVDVWYDELTSVDSVKYLLEIRLGMTNCNTTDIERILHQYVQSEEDISTSMLEKNNVEIESYVLKSRKKVGLSLALPSLPLQSGVTHGGGAPPSLCIMEGGDGDGGCAHNPPLLNMGKSNERYGPVFFWNPVQRDVTNPVFYFGVNAPLPMPSAYGEKRDFVLTTFILNDATLETMDTKVHSTLDSTQVIKAAKKYTAMDRSQRVSGVQLHSDCLARLPLILCHKIPSSLNISNSSYHLKMTVTSLDVSWAALSHFSFFLPMVIPSVQDLNGSQSAKKA